MPQQRTHPANDRYFQMHGLAARPPRILNAALQQAIDSMRRTLYGPSAHELTPPEIALLQQAGADVDEHPDRDDPMATYVSAFGAILATGLTPAQAAARLGGITPVRVRQMIRERTLHAVRIDGRWTIPVHQFGHDGLVPNIGAVNAAVPNTLDAVSVLRWFTTPDPELEAPDGQALTPLDWLKAGMDPAPVVEMAGAL
ncbi:MAG: helix-turn-helix domain-containing protein [Acidobacteria bacterium]|nr:helix-turn-helix domain-containing protein [Acidobacteriota bacterium]